MILVLVIAFLAILILTVSISSFITKKAFNKKEETEESKYDIASMEVNTDLSSEIKAANKEVKKAESTPQNNNKFVVEQNVVEPQTIINNMPETHPESTPAPEVQSPANTELSTSATTPSAQTTQAVEQPQSATDAPIDPFNLNGNK